MTTRHIQIHLGEASSPASCSISTGLRAPSSAELCAEPILGLVLASRLGFELHSVRFIDQRIRKALDRGAGRMCDQPVCE